MFAAMASKVDYQNTFSTQHRSLRVCHLYNKNGLLFLFRGRLPHVFADLLETGYMQRVPFQPFVVSRISIAQNKSSGKMRLILDLNELNHFVEKKKVKIKDWNAALNYFRKDYCFSLFKFDLKSCYHHIARNKKSSYIFCFLLERYFLPL